MLSIAGAFERGIVVAIYNCICFFYFCILQWCKFVQ